MVGMVGIVGVGSIFFIPRCGIAATEVAGRKSILMTDL